MKALGIFFLIILIIGVAITISNEINGIDPDVDDD